MDEHFALLLFSDMVGSEKTYKYYCYYSQGQCL